MSRLGFWSVLALLSALCLSPAAAAEDSREHHFLKVESQSHYLTGILEERPGERKAPGQQVEVVIEGEPAIIIRADEIESDLDRRLNHFIGHVSITRGPETVTADRALWSDRQNTAEVVGNIRIQTGEFIIMANRAIINLDLQMAKIYDGSAFFPAQNYYLKGALIERLGEKIIHIENGSATTCDGPNPSWTIEAESLTVTQGGYATASGVSFNAGGQVPIVRTPYFVFPVKNERQSGLLFPGLANSSRDGLTVALPLFWATGENHDLTYTPVWREKRGLANTLEGRYHFEKGRGLWQFTYLNDNDPQHFYYKNSPDLERTKERYWLRAQNEWHFGAWDLNLNLDLVSDPLYLAEFRNDFDGFFNSYNALSREFGHSVNEYLDPLRNSSLFAQRTGYDTFFRGTLEYTEDLYSQGNRDTIQKLPSLQYNMVSRPVVNSLSGDPRNLPRVSLNMRYDYFTRSSNQWSYTDETGHRMILNPSMTWNTPVGGLATFRLDGELELSMYGVNGHRPYDRTVIGAREAARHDRRDNRLTGALEAALSTTFSRVYSGGPGDASATRHQFSPTIAFSYVGAPDDQSDLPYWDYYDRRLSRRTVRYGFLNTFVSKTPSVDEKGRDDGFEYFQFLKIGLWSSYEFADNLEWANRPFARYYTTDYYDRGAGPVELEIETFFNPYFSARLVSAVDGRTGQTTSHDLSFKVADFRGDSLTLTYDYDRPSVAQGTGDYEDYKEVRADLSLVFSPEWYADFSARYDVREGRALESHARIMYQAQCYGLGLLFSDSDNDRRVGLVIDLLGLGSINHDRNSLASPPQFFYQ
jgi:LPS-assembly protein